MRRKTREEFISCAIAKYGNIYDYTRVDYVNSSTSINIICPKHGVFSQLPNVHVQGSNCPKCAIESRTEKRSITLDKEQFCFDYDNMTIKKMAKKYNCSPPIIIKNAKNYGLSKQKEYSTPSKEEFCQCYHKHTFLELKAKYQAPFKVLALWAKEYGLKGKKEYRLSQYPNKFNEIQKQVFIGCMLGDGSLKREGNKQASFGLNQCLKQKEWLEQKTNIFSEFINGSIRSFSACGRSVKDGQVITDLNKITYGCRIATVALPLFTQQHDLWYKNHKKIIPLNLQLTPLIIAVWFLDDGWSAWSKNKHRRARLCTDCFTVAEVEFLISQLHEFGVNAKLVKNNRKQPQIHINSDSFYTFIQLVNVGFKKIGGGPECLRYKWDISDYFDAPSVSGEGNPMSKMTNKQVLRIVKLFNDGVPAKQIAKQVNVTFNQVKNVVWEGAWSHITKGKLKPKGKLLRNNTSGVSGVHYIKRDKVWIAAKGINGKTLHLGRYKKKQDAIKARKKADKKYSGAIC